MTAFEFLLAFYAVIVSWLCIIERRMRRVQRHLEMMAPMTLDMFLFTQVKRIEMYEALKRKFVKAERFEDAARLDEEIKKLKARLTEL